MVKHIETSEAKKQEPRQEMDLGILMGLAFAAFSNELRASLARDGWALHNSFGYVARNLATQPLSLTELAKRIGITGPGALKIVQSMEDAGHLERVPDPNDARSKLLQLTKEGKTALQAARSFHQKFERELIKLHGERKVAALRELLTDIVLEHEEREDKTLFVRPI
jgi:DNA-binding MarR family transcriptional regulator